MAGARMSDNDRRRGIDGIQAARQALGRRNSTRSPARRDGQQLVQAAACVLVRDATQRVVVVERAGRPGRWRLPGGWVTADEYPLDTAMRVGRAQLGLDLDRDVVALVAVDWVPADDGPVTIVYVFDGGVLSAPEAAEQIQMGTAELASWQFAASEEWPELLSPASARRARACAAAAAAATTVYLQHGWPR